MELSIISRIRQAGGGGNEPLELSKLTSFQRFRIENTSTLSRMQGKINKSVERSGWSGRKILERREK